MEKLTFKCSKCGYTKEILGDIEDIVECELCGSLMDLEDIEETKEEDISLKELGKIIAIEGMQKNLKTLGNDKTYQLCEELFANPIIRLKYRKLFFESGGIFPERKLEGYI